MPKLDIWKNIYNFITLVNAIFLINYLNQIKRGQQKETSTQTSYSNLNNDDEVLQSRSQIINENFSIKKSDNQHLLRHQLTKDSGIDGDHTNNQNQHSQLQHQNSLKISSSKKKNKQINLTNRIIQNNKSSEEQDSEEIVKKDTEPFLNSTVTISKRKPSKLHKSMKIKNSFSPGSTRENSIEQEESAIDKMSNDESDLFDTNVIEEDEYVENEYIEDKYIGDEYPSDKLVKSGSHHSTDEIDSADEVVEELRDIMIIEEENNNDISQIKNNREILRGDYLIFFLKQAFFNCVDL